MTEDCPHQPHIAHDDKGVIVGCCCDHRGVVVAEPADDVELLLAGGAYALACDGDLLASRQWFEMAYQMAERSGDAQAMASAALGLAGLWVHEYRTGAGSVLLLTRLRHALALVDPQCTLALRLRVRLAGEADYQAGEHAAILAVLDEVRTAADPVARAEAFSIAHHCLLGPDHGAVRRTLAVELVTESFHTARRSDLLMGLLWQTVDLFLDADPHAERRLGELRALLEDNDNLAIGFVVNAIEVMLAIRAGRFDQAETLAQVCAQRGAAAGDIDATGWHGAQLVAIRWYQGRLAELLPMLHELVHSPTLSVVDNSCFAALAVAAAIAGDQQGAASALATLRGRDLADLPRSSSWLATMNGVVEAAHLLGDLDTSAQAYQLLSPFAYLPMVGGLGVVCFGSVHHALGVASLTTGDLDRAVDHLGAAIQHNLALGHRPAVLASRLRYAQALTRRAQPQDARTAQLELATATVLASAMGIALPDDARHEPPKTAVVCTRHGHGWRIDSGSRSVLVEHSIGMLHLAVLIANPGQEVHAVDLVAGPAVLSKAATDGTGLSTQPMLDRTAIGEYRHRLTRLRLEIDELESTNERERAARARAERDWLTAELADAAGLGGRTRGFPDGGERARIAVGKAIRRAIVRVAEADALIGEHLRRSVHTGIRCSYQPS